MTTILTPKQEPAFLVKDIPIYGRAILSPMAGYSDVPYRAICRAYGSSMHYTEFVPVEALQGKRNRFWDRLDKLPNETPMVFQIFGNSPEMILKGAQRIEELEPDIIDINVGCSTKRVSGRGAGVGLMRSPHLIEETFKLLTTHLSVPVTGKIRLGWNDNQNYLEVGKILQESGASLVAMHGRTKEQKYTGEADWDAIAHLKQSLSVPVIGNGDVVEPNDIERMLSYTGCDGVMIGRGAIGNPWIFAGRTQVSLSIEERFAGIRLHAREMAGYYGETFGLTQFRKHLKRYLKPFDGIDARLAPLLQTVLIEEFERYIIELEDFCHQQALTPSISMKTETQPLESCEPA